jgi:hypothetical protein
VSDGIVPAVIRLVNLGSIEDGESKLTDCNLRIRCAIFTILS